jgi:hypothetical protein
MEFLELVMDSWKLDSGGLSTQRERLTLTSLAGYDVLCVGDGLRRTSSA